MDAFMPRGLPTTTWDGSNTESVAIICSQRASYLPPMMMSPIKRSLQEIAIITTTAIAALHMRCPLMQH